MCKRFIDSCNYTGNSWVFVCKWFDAILGGCTLGKYLLEFGLEVEFISHMDIESLIERIHKNLKEVFVSHKGFFVTEKGVFLRLKGSLVDTNGKEWYIMCDKSIVTPDGYYGLELITPVLSTEEDYLILESVLYCLIKNSCYINEYCGVHIHQNCPKLDNNLLLLVKYYIVNQDSILTEWGAMCTRTKKYCKRIHSDKASDLLLSENLSKQEILDLWYESLGEGCSIDDPHNQSRYYLININSLDIRNTIEYRFFNSTLSIRVLESYLKFIQDTVILLNKSVDLENF